MLFEHKQGPAKQPVGQAASIYYAPLMEESRIENL